MQIYTLIYIENFLSYLLYIFLIPTTCLIPAIIILGINGKINKDYKGLRRYIKWWIYSIIPSVIIIIALNIVHMQFLKLVWI